MSLLQAVEIAGVGMGVVVVTLLFLAGVFRVLMGGVSSLVNGRAQRVVPSPIAQGTPASRTRPSRPSPPSQEEQSAGPRRGFRVRVGENTFHIDIEEL